jgi:hypothetical protein
MEKEESINACEGAHVDLEKSRKKNPKINIPLRLKESGAR